MDCSVMLPKRSPRSSISAQGCEISAMPTTEMVALAHIAAGIGTVPSRNRTDSASDTTGQMENTAVFSDAGMKLSAATYA